MKLLTAILGSAQGLRGEIKVDIRTDNPKERFAKGNKIQTDNKDFPQLTIRGFRKSNDKFYLSFVEITDRTMAEKMCFTKLYVDSDEIEVEEDSFYPHEVVGLEVYDTKNNFLGVIKDMLVGKAQDLLVVEPKELEFCEEALEEVLVPFVYEIVLEVNLEDNYVLLDPPGGLFPKELFTSK